MRKIAGNIAALGLAGIFAAAMSITALADPINGGYWKDDSIWISNNGPAYDIGKGATFSEEHPEITDPEYFLKDSINYPGEDHGYSSKGHPKSNYTEGTLLLLKKFVNSFDWIHSTELERFKAVYNRIGVGNHGNVYSAENPAPVSFRILETGRGICMDYSGDFRELARYVGLECVDYVPRFMHSANLVKINGQWFATDPSLGEPTFSNGKTYMVDYETELNRYANEVKVTDWYQKQMKTVDMQRKAEKGVISWSEYWQYVYPDKSIKEIEKLIGMDMESYEKLWK